MNTFNIANSFKTKKKRGWDRTFWAIDIHDTICKSTYKPNVSEYRFFKGAKKILQYLSKREDIVLILSTCSHGKAIFEIECWLAKNGIYFRYINCNPEVGNNKLSNFGDKYYFNVLLDDKAGFEGYRDWRLVEHELEKEYGEKI